MYARVCCATGWTWDYVGGEMTLPRLYALLAYWKTTPPLDVSVAALAFSMGAIKQETAVRADSREGQAALATVFSGVPMRPLPRPA